MDITTANPIGGSAFTSSTAPATAGVGATMDLAIPANVPGWNPLTAGGGLFKNLENFPGQLQYTPPKMSARAEGRMARRDAVRSARNIERTSEHIRGGIDRKADMVVGATLRVHARPNWDLLGIDDWTTLKPFAQACEREFNNWAYDSRCLCDAEGHYNFGGLMWMSFRNITGPDAECGGIIHYDEERAAEYNSRWATFVTVVDPDRIETPPEKAGDATVFEGKKLDKHGRMIGMYVRNRHPGDPATSAEPLDDFTFVPRETNWGRAMAFHWFVKTRGGQQRGMTSLTTVLRKSGMLDTFDDAHLGAAVIDQILGSYIETMATPETVADQLAPKGTNGKSPWDYKLDYYDKAKIRIGGVRIPTMPPGDKVVMESAKRALGDPTMFRNGFLREFASALGISFEQLSQNFSDANYSAARAALLEVWRGVLSMRKLFTAHVASLIYAAVIEEAIFKGRIALPAGAPPFQENRAAYTGCAWTGPGMGWIDPQKEANAIETLLRLKVKSRQEVVAEDGRDYLETFDQIEQENIEAEERHFTLDTPIPGVTAAQDPGQAPEQESSTKPKKKAGVGAKDGDGDGQVEEE